MTKLILTALLLGAGLAAPAAASVTFTGTTAGGPTFTRPLEGLPPTALSGIGAGVAYDVTGFTVSQSGGYDFLMTGLDPDGWDTFLFVYADGFDPADPLANVLAGNDDLGGIGLSGFDDLGLDAGTLYFAVATGFASDAEGRYALRIDGPGTVAAPIPEPAAWAMMLAGFVLAGVALRVRRPRPACA
jgi:hypothetical protein